VGFVREKALPLSSNAGKILGHIRMLLFVKGQVHQAVVTNHFSRQDFGNYTFGGHANSWT